MRSKKLIAGNWKMNGTLAEARALAVGIADGLESELSLLEGCDFVVCPPFVHVGAVGAALAEPVGGAVVSLGAQDCAAVENGAYTGDVSAAMLVDAGCDYVILGHSERRQYHKETDSLIAAKAKAAQAAGLITIICVGESEDERASDAQDAVVAAQLAASIPDGATAQNCVIAYEPVWAIGTGKTARVEDVAAMHLFIREKLKERLADSAQMRILYGGSVKPDNTGDLMRVDHVDGALIGGASLKADQYLGIARAAGK